MKPLTLSEEVIKPYNFGRWFCQEVGQAALSNNTVCRKIYDLSIDIRSLGLQGFSKKNLASTGRVYTYIQLQSVNLLCSLYQEKESWGRVFIL